VGLDSPIVRVFRGPEAAQRRAGQRRHGRVREGEGRARGRAA